MVERRVDLRESCQARKYRGEWKVGEQDEQSKIEWERREMPSDPMVEEWVGGEGEVRPSRSHQEKVVDRFAKARTPTRRHRLLLWIEWVEQAVMARQREQLQTDWKRRRLEQRGMLMLMLMMMLKVFLLLLLVLVFGWGQLVGLLERARVA